MWESLKLVCLSIHAVTWKHHLNGDHVNITLICDGWRRMWEHECIVSEHTLTGTRRHRPFI